MVRPVKAYPVLATVLAGFASMTMALAQDKPTLPGGASSLQETYDDWRVACLQNKENEGHICSLSQTQRRQGDGARILSMELVVDGDDERVKGRLILPFGLRLADGATLRIDEQDDVVPVSFSTCLKVGCIVPLSFTGERLAALRQGDRMNVETAAINNDQPFVFQVSLKGFAAALDRVIELGGQ